MTKEKSKVSRMLWISLAAILFSLLPSFTFAQQVDTAWVRRYNGPGNGGDKAVALAVDDSGNVYVTGSSFDSATGYDFATIKYFPNGDTAWVRLYNGPTNKDDFATALALDATGNVYVTGRSNGEFATIRYDFDGNQLWVRRLSSLFSLSTDGAYALALDELGNVYVTGQLADNEFLPMGVTIKYNQQGDALWSSYAGQSIPFQRGLGVVVDITGNAYANGLGGTIKYDSLGNQLWNRSFPGTSRAIALDNGSNVYAVGASDSNFTVIKYNTTGDQLWLRRSNSRSEEWQGASFVAADKYDNVYVVGNYFSTPDAIAWTTIKYDSTGNQLWFQAYYGIDGGQGREPKAMALDSSGNVYVTGYDAWYAATLKYDSQGALLWEKKYGDIDHGTEMSAIALDQSGNVYVTGSTQSDFLTIKYAPLPELKGDLNRDGMLSLFDIVLALNCVFLGISPLNVPPAACDLNCDGLLTAADVVILLNMTFLSTPPPC